MKLISSKKIVQVGEGLYVCYRSRDHGRTVVGTLTNVLGQPMEGTVTAQHTIRPPESVEAAEIVKQRLLSKYQAHTAAGRPPGEKAFFTEVWETFGRLCPSEDERMRRLNGENWAYSTFRAAYTYLIYQILPRLDALGPHPTQEDIRKIHEDLVEQASNSKVSLGIHAQARKNLIPKLRRCDVLYQQMQSLMSRYGLPELDLRMEGCAVPDVEQCKSLPDAVRIRFAAILMLQVETPWGGIALSLGFMLLCGLRTSESAALYFQNLEDTGDTWMFWVRQRLDGDTVTPILKTESSYRRLPVARFLRDMLSLRRRWLEGQGYTPAEIDHLPISGRPEDPTRFAPCYQISAAGRALLLASGCGETYWEGVRDLMRKEPDPLGEGGGLSDITAYALRRDFASRAANHCGVSAKELDYALGHKVQGSVLDKRAFYSTDNLAEFGRKLERYVFDPNHSGNPAYLPIEIHGDQEIPLFPSPETHLHFQDDMVIQLWVQSVDAGKTIQALFSDGEILEVRHTSVPDPPQERHVRPLLGENRTQSWYEEQIAEARSEKTRQIVERHWKEMFGNGEKI